MTIKEKLTQACELLGVVRYDGKRLKRIDELRAAVFAQDFSGHPRWQDAKQLLSESMEEPDAEEIQDKALELIERDGSTTNLDVKRELRAAGRWITQEAVSSAMRALSATGAVYGLGSNAGSYLVWELSKPSVPSSSSTGQPDGKLRQLIGVISDVLKVPRDTVRASTRLREDLDMNDMEIYELHLALGGSVDVRDCATVQDVLDQV